ncbi:hypothetical protein NZD89_16475 [Alicyclobacillus fastidiosus]|uniref:Uncharacterized protein n=1 Tax=Alicyclobacillus fastidiosus TaxID=392011 RepID=A0ABY6ZB42_9BACL|nr:hypothetical protein [Alicyclobacillus fastidiosus]WAH39988.1 hypothetical protein NZD89_16475 [Alicyclobacillus fastidiosus]
MEASYFAVLFQIMLVVRGWHGTDQNSRASYQGLGPNRFSGK